ncbi:hypothetical protein EH165_13100 [Nakamurella antarctica]|uniref:Tetratricopeptide repeat-containing protein n=1 Tax=Nakamurella antarctica TaxID=1902245 RepID=A0A3G8ZQ74_9ACTN|nr:hypothetical protein [Nakamurella antarctica]AZI58937.1 hypothetical protein EH165_13100 [Nakamurella antarctica]
MPPDQFPGSPPDSGSPSGRRASPTAGDGPAGAARRAELLLNAGRFDQAWELVRDYVPTGNLAVMLVAAQAQTKLTHYDEAQKLAEAAVAAYPSSPLALLVLAKVFTQRRFPWHVHEVLTKALALAPSDPRLHTEWVLADLLGASVNYLTEKHAREAVSLQPGEPAARQLLSLTLFRLKDKTKYAEAQALAAEAAAEAPDSSLTGLTLSLTSHRRWNLLPVMRHELQTLRVSPTDVNARGVLVLILLRILGAGLLIYFLVLFVETQTAYESYGDVEAQRAQAAGIVLVSFAAVIVGFWAVVIARMGRLRGALLMVIARSPVVLGALGLQLASFLSGLLTVGWQNNEGRAWLLAGFSCALSGTLWCATAIWLRRTAAITPR